MNNIEAVLHAAEGEIIGKIRTQKIFYLLNALGMESDYSFSYHHYGPYSQGLANQIDMLILFEGKIHEEQIRGNFGNSYSIYSLPPRNDSPPNMVGSVAFEAAKEYIAKMKAVTSVVLELAATIHWLKHREGCEDWQAEVKLRKPQKATEENVREAFQLLQALKLA
jgi:uncharacterized protein YwgA